MVRMLVGTDSVRTSQALATYLGDALTDADEAVIINSHVGGADTDDEDLAEGDDALDVLEEALPVVERHQYVRGNEPVEDMLAAGDEFDVDEYAIGMRKRSPVGKVMFGSTAQNILLEVDRPVRCIPLVG
jgi:nucleotide-binding universal stress UspA family protein